MIRLLSIFFVAVALFFTTGSAKAQNFWAPAGLQGDSVGSIVIDGSGRIFVGVVTHEQNVFTPPNVGVFRSDDNGNTWVMLKNPRNDQGGTVNLGPVYGFTPNGKLYMGGVTGGGRALYRSDDTGGNIVADSITEFASTDPSITSMAFAPNGQIYIATGSSGLYISDENGNNWEGNVAVNFPNSDDYPSYIACSPQGILYAASATQLSEKNSMSGPWVSVGGSFSGFGDAPSFAFDKNGNIVAGGNNGLFYSNNNGNSWTTLTNPGSSGSSYALAVAANGDVFCGPNDFLGNESGLYVSTDTGGSWTATTSGLTNTYANGFAINRSGIVFAATYGGVFQSVASTGGVKEIAGDIPTTITLEQNYPNPVVSNSTIHFSIPDPAMVSIKVYDVTGMEIADFANCFYAAGTYDVSFDGSQLQSGMYIYRIEAGGQSLSRTFVVLP